MKYVFFHLILCFAFLSNAQALKTISHEDMWLMNRVGTPKVSPDGRLVVFSVTEPSYIEKDQVTDLWICTTDGDHSPKKLTAAKSGESSYTWSTDGKKIAFVAKRDGDEEAQIYIIPIDGGEAQKFSNIVSGASNPKWSPDGSKILFTSSVYPGCFSDSLSKKKIEEKKNLRYKARVYESFPIRNWDKWLDEKQTHLFVQHIDSAVATNILAKSRCVNSSGYSFGGATWISNDEVIFSASTISNTSAYQNAFSSLYSINVNAISEEKIITDTLLSYSNPFFKDGFLYYSAFDHKKYTVYQLEKLFRIEYPKQSKPILLNKSLDRPINNYEALSDGSILASIENHGRDEIVKIDKLGQTFKTLTTAEAGSFSNLSASYKGDVIITNYEKANMPPEIARINVDGGHTMLSKFNEAKLRSLDLKDVETFYTTTSRGKKIRSILLKPAQFDANKKYPLFVMMHGGPSISYKESWGYRWNYHLIASDQYVMLMTDYSGSTGYGEEFGESIHYDPFKGPAEEIQEAAADAVKRYGFIDEKKTSSWWSKLRRTSC